MEKELLALLRLGLGNTTAEQENLSDFIMLPAVQWARIGELAQKQGVLGILLDGVERLEVTGYVLLRELPLEQKLEWIGEVLQIEQANQHQKTVMNDLAEKWVQEGCRVMVFKGQANGTLYPRPEHRSTGDVDCYLFDNYAKGNDLAREEGADVDEHWYKHSVISYKGETFENHKFFVHTRDGERGKRLEKDLEDALKINELYNSKVEKLSEFVEMPPVQWNAMFLSYHACAHFVSEGLRLKQILDWAMFLKLYQNDIDWEAFYAYCNRNHLRRFADSMTNISVKYLGVVIDNSAIVCDSLYADKILQNALYGEDYVFSSGKSGWANRWHIVKNIFKYRWKYEKVYQMSIYKQLWFYITGYIFKTD